MPIVQVPYPNALPTAQTDYSRQNDLLLTGFYRVNEPSAVDGGNIVQGAVFQCGGVVYYCTAATAIGGVASNYVKLTPIMGGDQLQADYVANLAGVAWNSAYNGYYDGSGNLYVFNEALAMIAGEIAAVVQRYAQQDRTGDLPVGRDILPARNVDFTESGVDGDHAINFASDAALSWDEAGNQVLLNKTLNMSSNSLLANYASIATYIVCQTYSDSGVSLLAADPADEDKEFILNKPITAWLNSVAGAAHVFNLYLRQNTAWQAVKTITHVGAGTLNEFNLHLNPGHYRMYGNNNQATTTLKATGVFGAAAWTVAYIITTI